VARGATPRTTRLRPDASQDGRSDSSGPEGRRNPYETASGVADFHALRAAYVSNHVASGASVKTCQILARHSSPALTIGVCAKASVQDIQGAVDALADPTAGRPAPESMAATGTEGRRISKRLALHLHIGGAVSGRLPSEMGVRSDQRGGGSNPLPYRVLSAVGGPRRQEAPGGFEPPVEVLQTSALPLGYGADG
jgi:hypothetical protein